MPSIKDDLFVVLNHRLELIVVHYGDVKSGSYPFKSGKNGAKKKTKGRKDFPSFQVIDKGNFEDGISDISFSPCGLYVTYTFQTSRSTSIIRIANVYTGKTFDITKQSEFCDHTPAFDPDGRYIYFISDRQYRPVDDEVWGSISIPTTDVLMLVLLQNNLPSPFLRCPMRPGAADDSETDSTDASESESGSSEEDSSGDDSDSSDDSDDSRDYSKRGQRRRKDESGRSADEEEDDNDDFSIKPFKIHLAGVENRIVMLPNTAQGYFKYKSLVALDHTHLIYIRRSIRKKGNQDGGADYDSDDEDEDENNTGSLIVYNLLKRKEKVIRSKGVLHVSISMDGLTVLIVGVNGDGEKVCFAYPAKKVVGDGGSGSGSSSDSDDCSDDDESRGGYGPLQTSGVVRINSRISLEINTTMEWRQMFTQAWQAQANEFVFPHLIKWQEIYSLYEPLLDRINTRVELNDLMKELVSEMACSHIYLDDGDTDVFGRCDEDIAQGFLGVETNHKNEITRILKGDFWSLHTAGPLSIAGINVEEGDKIVSINHTKVTPGTSLAKLLKGLAGKEIYLGVQDSNFQNGQKPMRKEDISTKPKSHKQQKHGKSGAKGSKAGDKYENKSGKVSKSRGKNGRKGKKDMKNKDFNRFNEKNGKKNSTKKSQMTNSRKPVQYNAKKILPVFYVCDVWTKI